MSRHLFPWGILLPRVRRRPWRSPAAQPGVARDVQLGSIPADLTGAIVPTSGVNRERTLMQ
uniref:Uncharacterized protein n=1 Tax=Utricularia reniformis TaxID=192314 RepID=A0A1Y0AYV1_9LAMI|nr:hypothetical protein AEK19_MT0912 [Utricularia reniformis]ART30330.1 hypothetical protein AEK19_MT0912 [Utricularia reniformis]